MSKNLKIFLSIAAVVLVAVLGSIFVNIGLEWVGALNKPKQFDNNLHSGWHNPLQFN